MESPGGDTDLRGRAHRKGSNLYDSSPHSLVPCTMPHPFLDPRSKNPDRFASWTPTNVGHPHTRAPSLAVDNWSAAWKVRRHWEDMTELRKAAGKTIY
jgi:hypothetical protein